MYNIKTVTRICEGASQEDIANGDGYETVYLIHDETGEIVIETKDQKIVQTYEDRN